VGYVSQKEHMNSKTAIGLGTLTVTLNGLLGHYFAPSGIFLTPIVLTVTTSLVCFGTNNVRAIHRSALTYLFVASNDISIRLYSGGSHDLEGLGWILGLLLIGLLPTVGILSSADSKMNQETLTSKSAAIALFVVLMAGHLLMFSKL
jgi:hypothetical protein